MHDFSTDAQAVEQVAAFRTQRHRAVTIRRLILWSLFLTMVALSIGARVWWLAEREADGNPADEATVVASQMVLFMVAIAQTVMWICLVVAWVRWQYRAYSNLRLVGSRETDVPPERAVVYWFVPILLLFRPYHIMKELWRRSVTGNARGTTPPNTPEIYRWWWATWIAGSFVGTMAFRAALTEGKSTWGLQVAADVLTVVCAILALRVIRSVADAQDRLVNEIGTQS